MCQLSAQYCVITIVCAIINHALHLVVLLTEYPIVTGLFIRHLKLTLGIKCIIALQIYIPLSSIEYNGYDGPVPNP